MFTICALHCQYLASKEENWYWYYVKSMILQKTKKKNKTKQKKKQTKKTTPKNPNKTTKTKQNN